MNQTLPDPTYQAEFYADVPTKRALAWVVDSVLIGSITLLILPLTAFAGIFFLPFLFMVIGFLYRVVTLSGRSATWGMRLMAIEFRAHDGARFDLPSAFLHTLGYTLTFSTLLPQLLSMALMLTGSRGQGLTDLVMGSVAINRAARS